MKETRKNRPRHAQGARGLDDLFAQARLDAHQSFGVGGRLERVDRYAVVLSVHAPRASHALLKSRWAPWQVGVNNDTRPLQVHSFAQNIGGDEHRHPSRFSDLGAFRIWCELREQFTSRYTSTRHQPATVGEHRHTAIVHQARVECFNGGGIFGEHNAVCIAMALSRIS